MRLITWNTQWCRGVDGRVDPARIARDARALADFDVLCLQEIAIGFASLPGSTGEDQMALLADALPGFRGFFGAATDRDDGRGGRSRFGNALFTRLPVRQVFRHLLPWPADPDRPSMQRLALEAVLDAPGGPVRVTTTHLEYYSAPQRAAQVEALRHLHAEACAHARAPRKSGEPGSPFALASRPASAIVCGDCNFGPGSTERRRLLAPFDDGTPALRDAWRLVHGERTHAPTVGLHDRSLPTDTWDFVFVSEDLADRVSACEVGTATQASDHQPVLVEIG